MKRTISRNTVRRIPKYLRKLIELDKQKISCISSRELAEQLSLTASQIRQDFCFFGEFGRKGYGYNVRDLCIQISNVLGIYRGHSAILVGCGNMGKALLCNFNFAECGITLQCAFDIDPNKVGTYVNGLEIKDLKDIRDYLVNNCIDIAVLCVPKHAAKSVADMLIEKGKESLAGADRYSEQGSIHGQKCLGCCNCAHKKAA